MAKNIFDQFSKQFLEEILAPLGAVETSHEVSGETQFVDVYFIPNPQPNPEPFAIGILGRIAQTPCLIEPFHNQPSPDEIRSCLLKLFQVHGNYRRQARREDESLPESQLPYLWILASSASETLLNGLGTLPSKEWESGVYFLPALLRTAIISINRLSANEDTLWLRLLGKGKTQQQAINEVIAFDNEDPRRSSILRLLANWKISLEITGQVSEEEELIMALSQAYLEWEQQTEQRGRAQGKTEGKAEEAQSLILRQLSRRIGEIPPELRSPIQALSLTQLESLGEALLDFSAPSDLIDWMRSQS
jgi:Domain of unknown function (DUF4351)